MDELARRDLKNGLRVSLVVPAHNEATNVDAFYSRVRGAVETLDVELEVIFVNDGSSDQTLALLIGLREQDARIKIIDLSRNFGKEIALTAGIERAGGDVVIPIDMDLQHPPEVIPEMVNAWVAGADVVFATRVDRNSESFTRRLSAKLFYRVLGFVGELPNHDKIGDFCLLDRKVVDVLKNLPEHNRFMKGLFAWAGYQQAFVPYQQESRRLGVTSWNYWRLWNLAVEGITSFSTWPLRVWTYIGFVLAALSLTYAVYTVIRTLIYGIVTPGFASIMVAVLFIGGIQLISLGVIGEYIGRIFSEVKGRPLYLVRNLYGLEPVQPGESATGPVSNQKSKSA
jgi:glycosyltransferase involved in cell wall biosynthesis